MSNDEKTYQIYFSIKAKDLADAVKKAIREIQKNPTKRIKEIKAKDRYKVTIVNK